MIDSGKSDTVSLSVVIAVRNAEETIGRDVRRLAEFLRGRGDSFEILAVDDGCCDNSPVVLRLLATQVPELRICPGDARGRAFIRGIAEGRGALVLLLESGRQVPAILLGETLARLAGGRGCDAVVFRGSGVVGRRMACLPAVVRASGRGDDFERSFERNARGVSLDIVGNWPRRPGGLLAPVLRFLAA